MRKNCETCKHEEFGYPYKTICDGCISGKGKDDPPSNWEAAEHYKPDTNAEHMRGMTDDELGAFLCLTFGCKGTCPGESLCVAGDGKANGLKKWLKQPVEEV